MKKIIYIPALLVLLLIFGCDGRSAFDENQMARRTASFGYALNETIRTENVLTASMSINDASVMYDIMQEEDTLTTDASGLIHDDRKLIKRAYVSIRTENLGTADNYISSLMNTYNSYAASTETYENSRFYSIRVPSQFYDVFLAEMDGMGRLLHKSENTEDVTLRYYDLEGRLEMKRELLQTFQSYLTRARTIEEILAVETRIAELQYDIEGTGMQLRHLANRVEYATIDLHLSGPVTVSQSQNETFSERITQMFGGFGNFLSTVTLIILGIIIYGIPSLLILAFLFWLLFGKLGLIRKLWGLIGKRAK